MSDNVKFALSYAYHKLDMFKEDPSKPSVLAAAISVGWGIAATMALVMQASLLFSATGPADLPAANCPSVSAFHVQALLTLPIALLHILLTVILFDAYQRKSWFIIGLSVFLHLVASFSVRYQCWYSRNTRPHPREASFELYCSIFGLF